MILFNMKMFAGIYMEKLVEINKKVIEFVENLSFSYSFMFPTHILFFKKQEIMISNL